MADKYKQIPKRSAHTMGGRLRDARKKRGESLVQVANNTQIDVGQLSRFENGQFKRLSKNLQIYVDYLQILVDELGVIDDPILVRVLGFASLSPAHRVVVERLLDALESLSV